MAVHGLERRPRRRRRGPSLETLRNSDAQRFFRDQYGNHFPDDDAGRDDLYVALQLRAPRGEGEVRLREYIGTAAPWMEEAETERLLDRVYSKPILFKADTLGLRIGLTEATRTRLRITTIGAADLPLAEREARRKAKQYAWLVAKRRASGMKPRAEYEANSASQKRPWEAFGISRRTWERRGKPSPPDA